MYEAKGKKKMQKGNSGDSLYCCSWTLKVPRQSAFSLSFWAFLYLFMLCLVIVVVVSVQSYVTVCNPMDCCPLDSCVHGILQARILEWVAIPFSRESSQPRYRTWVSCIVGRFFTVWATGKSLILCLGFLIVLRGIGKIMSTLPSLSCIF